MSRSASSAPAVGIYSGSTWHARHAPITNAFRYRVWSVLVDLDDLPQLAERSRLLTVDRPGVCSLWSEDHALPLDAGGVKRWLVDRGVDLRGGSVRLLTSPRVLGYAFNPLSLWWCHDLHGELAAVIAEVHNTYGGRHAYLLRPSAHDGRAATDKQLYVSPFFPVDGRYEMRLSAAADRFDVHIGYDRDGARVFDATWQGRHRPFSDRSILATLLRNPLWSVRVKALIHWQGLKLWLRRLTVFPRQAEDRGEASRPERHDVPDPRDVPDAHDTSRVASISGARR